MSSTYSYMRIFHKTVPVLVFHSHIEYPEAVPMPLLAECVVFAHCEELGGELPCDIICVQGQGWQRRQEEEKEG